MPNRAKNRSIILECKCQIKRSFLAETSSHTPPSQKNPKHKTFKIKFPFFLGSNSIKPQVLHIKYIPQY